MKNLRTAASVPRIEPRVLTVPSSPLITVCLIRRFITSQVDTMPSVCTNIHFKLPSFGM
jgi:hypothetical protein